MSLLWLDSFDDRTSNFHLRYDANSGGGSLLTTSGRTGNGVNKPTTTAIYIEKTVPPGPTFIQGVAVKPTINTVLTTLLEFMDGATSQIYVRNNADTTISVVNGSGAVLGTTTVAQAFVTNVFQYLEFKATIHNTAGAYELRVNGVTLLSAINVNTRNSANNQATAVRLRWSDNGSGGTNWDDYYICNALGTVNNDFLGAIKIECKFPSAPGTTTGWTPTGAAANWDCVNDTAPNGDTDYVSAAIAGTKDTNALQDMTATAGTVVGLNVHIQARKDDLNPRQIATVVRTGGTDYTGPTVTMNSTYTDSSAIWENNPNTSSPWSLADVNGMEAGVIVIS